MYDLIFNLSQNLGLAMALITPSILKGLDIFVLKMKFKLIL